MTHAVERWRSHDESIVHGGVRHRAWLMLLRAPNPSPCLLHSICAEGDTHLLFAFRAFVCAHECSLQSRLFTRVDVDGGDILDADAATTAVGGGIHECVDAGPANPSGRRLTQQVKYGERRKLGFKGYKKRKREANQTADKKEDSMEFIPVKNSRKKKMNGKI